MLEVRQLRCLTQRPVNALPPIPMLAWTRFPKIQINRGVFTLFSKPETKMHGSFRDLTVRDFEDIS